MWNVRFTCIISLLWPEEEKNGGFAVIHSDFAYVNDEEVEPAPGVGEILDEAVRHPLQQHLQDENVGKDLVRIFQDRLDVSPTLDVNILESLRRKQFEKKRTKRTLNGVNRLTANMAATTVW